MHHECITIGSHAFPRAPKARAFSLHCGRQPTRGIPSTMADEPGTEEKPNPEQLTVRIRDQVRTYAVRIAGRIRAEVDMATNVCRDRVRSAAKRRHVCSNLTCRPCIDRCFFLLLIHLWMIEIYLQTRDAQPPTGTWDPAVD